MLWQLSVRNLLRHRRRNGLLLAAIVMAVAGVVVSNALIRGFQVDMSDRAVDSLTGHIAMHAPGYLDDPNISRSFALGEDMRAYLERLSARDDVMGWAARVQVPAVIMSERETRGVSLVGVDPLQESISFLGDVTIDGRALADVDERGIVIGKRLAEQLETVVGRRLVLMAQDFQGQNAEAGYRIVGTFDADGTGLEKQFAFTGRNALAALLRTQRVTGVSVRFIDEPPTAAVLHELRSRFDALQIAPWQALQPQAAAMFEFADIAIFVWFLIMMGALSFGLVNTLATAVMERVRELGLLRALGMQRGSVVGQVVIESMLIMAAGLALGLLLGVGAVTMLSDGIDLSRWAEGMEMAGMRPEIVPVLKSGDLLLVAVLSLVLGLLASLYPARKAVRISPLEALGR